MADRETYGPNDRLRRARESQVSPSGSGRPMSRRELADAASAHLRHPLSDDYIARLERGEIRWPSKAIREALRCVLGASDDGELGFYITRPARTLPPVFPAGVTGDPPDVSVVTRAADRDESQTVVAGLVRRHVGGRLESTTLALLLESVDRRQVILSGLAAVAAACGLIGPRPLRGRVGQGDVDRLTALTALYRSVDYELGGGALVRDVGGLAESASALLDLSYADALAPRLMSAVAAVRQLAGWVAFGAGLHVDAQRHFVSAERTAVAADDRLLVARVRYSMARQYQHLWHNRDALDTLRLARTQVGSAATPAVTAMLLGAEAASLAALGDRQGALRNLSQASDAFARVVPDQEPEWMRFYGKGELLAQYGRVYLDFARSDRRTGAEAVRWVTDAIAAFGPQDIRSSVLNEVGLCSALFLTGETEQAIAIGHRVISQAQNLASRRILDRITNLRRDLEPHRSVPAVAEFAHFLATVGTGRP